MILTSTELSMFGRRVTVFDHMREEDSERLVTFMRYQLIGERLKAATSSKDRHQTPAERLFEFCIEALNDLRIEEAWHEDYLMRLTMSDKFSALLFKGINDNENQAAPQTA